MLHNGTYGRVHVAITKSDSIPLARISRVYCNATGNIAVKDAEGNGPITYALTAGQWVPVLCSFVMSTNTTSTSIVAVY